MDEEVVITIDHVYKDFKLPHDKANSVKGAFTQILTNIGKKRNIETQHALRDITFDIKRGEFFGIVGRNGSGKSTLLKMLAGIYQPNKGKITVEGRLVPFIELGVGFNGELTGRENVYLNGALIGFSRDEVDAIYDEIVAFAELEKFMDQKLKNYSSGMQVRLAFSLAIRADADILLVDEVLAVGDADFQRKCFRYFKMLKKRNKTVVFVTHDMNAVREYCDRAAFIEKSELVSVGKPEKISRLYERLLQPKAEATEADQNETANRWGDGAAKITAAKVDAITDDHITLSMVVKGIRECDDPVLGFVIRNGAGVSLLGTNSLLEKIKLETIMPGDERKIQWTFANILADGEYTATFAALYDSGSTTADWWEDACQLIASQTVHSPFLVAPTFNTKMESEE